MEGTVFAYYLGACPEVEKGVLFGWFRQLATELSRYRRSSNRRGYRYLNPYSILLSRDKNLYLLNLDAPENEEIVRKMQGRAVRSRFLTPICNQKNPANSDLFGYGKTIQFMLACLHPVPQLTASERRKLLLIIAKCTGEGRKHYQSPEQVVHELPKEKQKNEKNSRLVWTAAAGILSACVFAVLLSCVAVLYSGSQKTEQVSGMENNADSKTSDAPETDSVPEAGLSLEMGASAMEKQLKNLLLENTSDGNEKLLFYGQELELQTVRCLATVYEREERIEEAIQSYGRLMELEKRKDKMHYAAQRKMELEASQGLYEKALQTGREAVEKTGETEETRLLMKKYTELFEKQNKGGINENEK